MNKPRPQLTCLDLFCGCGGFSLGMEWAGFRTLAAIDFNPEAIAVYRHNFPKVPNVLDKDLTAFRPEHLDELLQGETLDVIVGGPPCQGFSLARRRDGANHGLRFKEDSRRQLYQEFLRFVGYYHPRVFILENVLGIKSVAGGEFFTRVQSEARALGYRVHGEELRAWHYGVPQKRIRQLIIGTRRELPIFIADRLMPQKFAIPGEKLADMVPGAITLWEAIGDLPSLRANCGKQESEYEQRRRQSQLAKYGGRYLKKVLQIHKSKKLTAHCARPHSDRDLRDFTLLNEGESSAMAMRERGVKFEWPYSKEHFKDRYTRQHRNRLCSTIVAHLSKDGLMFIHPTQNRSLSPREAARVQSFPDWFEYPVPRTHQFRVIGNAVPPLVGETVGRGVRRYLAAAKRAEHRVQVLQPLPTDEREAVRWLFPLLVAAESGLLQTLPDPEFKRGWYSVGFLYPGLHPDSALEHGTEISGGTDARSEILTLEPRLDSPSYSRSGWPVVLAPLVHEAGQRFVAGRLKENEFYCNDAIAAGIRHFGSVQRRRSEPGVPAPISA